MCKQVSDKDFDELKDSMAAMHTDVAVMGNEIKKLTEQTQQLVEISTKTSVIIERTNENDKKISTLFKKFDEINQKLYDNSTINKANESYKWKSQINLFLITQFVVFVLGLLFIILRHHL